MINLNESISRLTINVKSMCEVMKHGGPDDEGFYINDVEKIVFGHRRLALIDTSPAGHQPMFYERDDLVITFNGEIYNYLELKIELEKLGFIFKTKSDTEVILAAYAAWDIKSFNKIKGMFAFALYDKKSESTYLVRDRSGIKPLYYSAIQKQLIFSSEVKAFKKTDISFEENEDWKIYFLAFGHIPEPLTTLANVSMLPKGHYLKWHHIQQSFSIDTYISDEIALPIKDKIAATKQVFSALNTAVKSHLLSDAPIGVFLSGGIDSSILTLLASEIQKEKGIENGLNTLSINFEENKFSEKPYQDLIIEKVKANHSDFTITKSFFDQHFPEALASMDQPTMDGINSWFVNYFAKEKGLKAVLSGVGADELFGGYPSFKRMPLVKLLEKIPEPILKKVSIFEIPIFKRAYYLSYKNTTGKYLFLRGIFTPIEISELLNLSVKKINAVLSTINLSKVPDGLSPQEEASWLEYNLYMQNQLLKDTDVMSMHHGVEVRVPYLDQDLVKLLKNIPSKIRFETTKPKSLLVDAFEHVLPKEIWNRPKMGFTFPFQIWLQKNSYLDTRLHKIENKKTNNLIKKFSKGKIHWSKAMALYIISADNISNNF
ncbi:asparagine synthase (glutamine-hydrolyzing) [Pedobacter mucosus]|nr:asparagine synthase (glutamine-hydrolyzing) [Pedobacter mucosus]